MMPFHRNQTVAKAAAIPSPVTNPLRNICPRISKMLGIAVQPFGNPCSKGREDYSGSRPECKNNDVGEDEKDVHETPLGSSFLGSQETGSGHAQNVSIALVCEPEYD